MIRSQNLMREIPDARSWGFLPVSAILCGVGLLIISLADAGARQSAFWAIYAFWIGIVVICLPCVVRLVSYGPSRSERLGLLVLLTLGLYMVKVLHSPVDFTFTDEFQHYRTLSDIVTTGHLYSPNPLSIVSPSYPGLEVIAHALVTLTGLSLFQAAILVIGLARVILILSLFGIYEYLSHSARFASLGAALYMANFNYVFWSAEFAYESLGLPLAVFILYLLMVCTQTLAAEVAATRVQWLIITSLSLLALLAVHHLTMYWLFAVIVVWTVCVRAARWMRRQRMATNAEHVPRDMRSPDDTGGAPSIGTIWTGPALIAVFILVMIAGWVIFQAQSTLLYLAYPLRDAAADLIKAFATHSTDRQLFQGLSPGPTPPLWERLLALISVGLTLLGLTTGLIRAWPRRGEALVILPVLIALMYPLTLPLRLLPRTWEIANRSSEFSFIGLAFLLAAAIVYGGILLRRFRRPGRLVCGILMTVLIMGGITSGWPFWARLPGPYLASAETRSIEPIGLAAARWTLDHLGPHRFILADHINSNLMGAFGHQDVVSYGSTQVYVASIPLAAQFGDWELTALRLSKTEFVVMDNRLTAMLPLIGYYVDVGEPGGLAHDVPLSVNAIRKFDNPPSISRIFDNGTITIYDMRKFNGVP